MRGDRLIMEALHSVHRREFGLASGLVLGVEPHDVERAEAVAAHLDRLQGLLAGHHRAEDEVLWPRLRERAPASIAVIVDDMEEQHHVVDALLTEAARCRQEWRRNPTRARTASLAERHAVLHASLAHHLDDEEGELMPKASEYLCAADWQQRARHSSRDAPLSEGPLLMEMLLYGAEPAAVRLMIPWVVRSLLGPVARRSYRAYAARVYGTSTP